eukprot:SAG31_NODE_2825_length_5038_cov_2.170277_2_plen_155_part_00
MCKSLCALLQRIVPETVVCVLSTSGSVKVGLVVSVPPDWKDTVSCEQLTQSVMPCLHKRRTGGGVSFEECGRCGNFCARGSRSSMCKCRDDKDGFDCVRCGRRYRPHPTAAQMHEQCSCSRGGFLCAIATAAGTYPAGVDGAIRRVCLLLPRLQ